MKGVFAWSAARELYRFVRDEAYEAIATGTELPEDSDAYRFRKYAKRYADLMNQDEGLSFDRAVRMKQIADEHMEYLERKHMVKMFEQQPYQTTVPHPDA